MAKRNKLRSVQKKVDFKAIVEMGHEAFLLYSAEGYVEYASPAVTKIAGYKKQDLVGRLGTDFIAPKYRATTVSKFKEALKKPGTSFVFEIQLVKNSGEVFWAEQAVTNMLHHPGVNAVVNSIRDISERKKAQADADVAQKQINDSQKFISNVLRVTKAPIFVKNHLHDFVIANEAFGKFLGRSLVQIIGKNDVDFLSPEEVKVFWRVDNEVLRTGKTISNEEDVTDKYGDTRRVITTKTRYIDRDGNRFVVASIKDITDERRVLGELSARNFELDQLMYKTSHDLRSPLASILGLVNLAKLDVQNQAEYLDKIEGRVKKLDEFVRSMLDYAKVSRKETAAEPIDLNKVITSSIRDLEFLDNFQKIKTTVACTGKAGFKSDPLLIGIIFSNIISNAYKYYRDNGSSFLKININVTTKLAKMIFEDNGIGIKQEHLDKIFNMFYRATDRSEGSGLGMYIVKQAVDKLGGSIDLKSKFGQGTKITITLPNLK